MYCKIVPIGAGGVGKTSIVERLLHNHFLEEYDPTIEETYRKQFVIDDEAILPDFLDHQGQEEYTALQELYQNAAAIILVYSITSLASFEEIQEQYYPRILKIRDENKLVPIVLIGNKCDLEPQRAVSTAMGEQLAKQYGILFFETSAKTNINVLESFIALIREMRKLNASTNSPKENKKNNCKLS